MRTLKLQTTLIESRLSATTSRLLCMLSMLCCSMSGFLDSTMTWDVFFLMLPGQVIALFALAFLRWPSAVLVSVGFLPWSIVIGYSKIHMPLALSITVIHLTGISVGMLARYAVVASLSLGCLWNLFASKRYALPHIAICVLAFIAGLYTWPAHFGLSWYAVMATQAIHLYLLRDGMLGEAKRYRYVD